MPIYEYQCQKCHHHLEALQRFADKPLRECPECGKHTLKRLISAPMFRLAGSGWYETDFKSDKEGRRNLAGKDEAQSTEAKDSGVEKKDATDSKKSTVTEPAEKSRAKIRAKPAVQKPAPTKPAPKKRAPKKPAPKKSARKR